MCSNYSPDSGGAQSVWVRDGNGTTGRLLYSSALLVNMGPPAPPGFEGTQGFTWSSDRNGTVTIGIVNSFGVSTPVGYYEATIHFAKGPSLDYAFLWVFLAGVQVSSFWGGSCAAEAWATQKLKAKIRESIAMP